MKDFSGKVAVITGGAGGLGRAVARRLAKGGAKIALWDIGEKALGEAVKEIAAGGGEARGYAVDVADAAAVREAAGKVRAELGPVDILDNNAGIVRRGDFVDSAVEDLGRTVDVNLKSYLWCTKEFLPGMIERNSGHLIMIASASGLLAVPGLAVYSATKHAVVGLSEALRLELRKAGASGVGMTIVCPSYIATGMFEGAKPPLLTRWLTPDGLAERIISAVRRNRLYVREPFMVKLVPLLKAIPCVGLLDRLGDLLGLHGSMDSFKGKAGS